LAEPIYQHELDGQEVEEEDMNLLGTTSGLADDRALAELLRLAPFDGTNTAKAILPYALRAGDSATVVPNGATGSARILPFRAIVGSRTGVATDPLAAWRDIRSSVYAQTTGSGAFGAAASFAPNTSGLPRWDLVYAAFTPDANGTQVTRYVRDPATGAISSPTVVTTLVQNVVVMVEQGTPSATPAPPAPPGDGGGTYYIPLAYVRIAVGFSATSTLLPADLLPVAPVVSLARIAGGLCLQPANQQFVPGGAALSAASLAAWGAGGRRPSFLLSPEMVGGESRIVAIDFSSPSSPSHPGALAIVDDSRDWRKRLFRWTCFAYGPAAATSNQIDFVWAGPSLWSGSHPPKFVPNASAVGVGQDIQWGFGQSFVADVLLGSFAGALAMLVNPPSASNPPSQLAQIGETIGLIVDLNDGKLKLYLRSSTPYPPFMLFVWIDATAPFPNWI